MIHIPHTCLLVLGTTTFGIVTLLAIMCLSIAAMLGSLLWYNYFRSKVAGRYGTEAQEKTAQYKKYKFGLAVLFYLSVIVFIITLALLLTGTN